ncbi:MAG: HlyD family type I secretion periplasmic adaptor subunit [Alphaproteobacteria bacterium]
MAHKVNFLNDSGNFSRYRVYLWLGIACVTTFFLWANFTNIHLHVRAPGKVIPSGKVRLIQHLEGGIINEILVKEGQVVQAGDSLFHMANTRAEADMKEIEVALASLYIKRTRLQAERDDKSRPVYDDALMQKHPSHILSEVQIFQSRRAELGEKIKGLEKRMSQKVLKLDELETNVENLGHEMKNAKEQLEIRKKLLRTGAISRSQYLETDSEVRNFTTRISKISKEIPITKSELSEIVNLLGETKQKWRSKVVEELGQINVDVQKLEERIKTFNDAVQRKYVESPIKGIVKKVHVNTIGGVIRPGQVIAEIIPVQETLIVEAHVSTEDRGKIWVGLPVIAKITAYDYSIHGGIKGELTYISADSFIDNQNRQYYQIRVELKKTQISEGKPIFPGMAVDVNILANEISVLGAILRPIYQIRENALRES